MKYNKVKAAILGCGVISDIYIETLKDKFSIIELIACYDRNDYKMEEKAEKYGIKAMSIEDIMKDSEIEMIINLTTPKAHYELNKMALLNGKHVYTEKMLATELFEGKELIEIAKEKNLRIGVAPDTFLGGGIQTARYILDKGLIGEPLSAVVSLNRNFDIFGDLLPHLYQNGGTMPFDTGCYYVTALLSLLGPAKKVTGFGRCYNKNRIGKRVDKAWFEKEMVVEDFNIMTSVTELESGALCTIHFNSESIQDERPCIEIY